MNDLKNLKINLNQWKFNFFYWINWGKFVKIHFLLNKLRKINLKINSIELKLIKTQFNYEMNEL